jgi:hypothetical protein
VFRLGGIDFLLLPDTVRRIEARVGLADQQFFCFSSASKPVEAISGGPNGTCDVGFTRAASVSVSNRKQGGGCARHPPISETATEGGPSHFDRSSCGRLHGAGSCCLAHLAGTAPPASRPDCTVVIPDLATVCCR